MTENKSASELASLQEFDANSSPSVMESKSVGKYTIVLFFATKLIAACGAYKRLTLFFLPQNLNLDLWIDPTGFELIPSGVYYMKWVNRNFASDVALILYKIQAKGKVVENF
eukprot:Gb_03084 [translate_table: standard]